MNQLKTSTLGALRFGGPDARAFLQGQLTNDLALLASGRPLLAAYCNPQGRVIAVLRLSEDGDGILARLPALMVDRVIEKLRRYVLRMKVTLSNENAGLEVAGEDRLRDIHAGQPQIYPETSELFVAQMLNLDLIDGISFNKGCYTGQEVIARAHYRGKVKRRMQRFRTLKPATLNPGEAGQLSDGRNFTVVTAAQLETGCSEFLAVAPLLLGENELLDTTSTLIEAEQLVLPYEISV